MHNKKCQFNCGRKKCVSKEMRKKKKVNLTAEEKNAYPKKCARKKNAQDKQMRSIILTFRSVSKQLIVF